MKTCKRTIQNGIIVINIKLKKSKVKVKLVSSVLKKYPGKSPIPVNEELNNEKIIYTKKENKVKCTRLSQKHEKK